MQWKAAEVAETVDRRVVANPAQVRSLLAGVREQKPLGEHLVAFFGCMYFAGLRPAEALALRAFNCMLPRRGWGRLNLTESQPRAGVDWTDDGNPRETRGLKHRGEKEMRSVPIPPELVQLLRDHMARYEIGPGDRMFRTGRGGPIQDSTYAAVWRKARELALTPAQVKSPLARRPYDLRHAAISLWRNAGVPATEVARRATHGVAVMLKVYANCIDGDEPIMNTRIDAALSGGRGTLEQASAARSGAEPVAYPWHEPARGGGPDGETAGGGLA